MSVGNGNSIAEDIPRITREEQLLLDQFQTFCPAARVPFQEMIGRAALDHEQDISLLGQTIGILLNHLIEHDKALQSLTPGGSEYVNDRQRCLKVNAERRAHQCTVIKGLQQKLAEFTWSIEDHDSIRWVKPMGTLWQQLDGSIVASIDSTEYVMKLPPVRP